MPKIKRESDSTPTYKGLGLFRDGTDTAASNAGSFAKLAVEPFIPDPDWKRCENEDRFKRVRIKEQAARNAVLALKKMQNTLQLHLLANSSCQTRIDKIGMSQRCLNITINFLIPDDLGLTKSAEEILARKKAGVGEKFAPA
jgi:hypothetical protein